MMTDKELFVYLDKITIAYKGDITHLTQAIGALYVGRLYGHRVLRIITSSPTHTRHEFVLGLKFSEVLPETTDESIKCSGYRAALKIDSAILDVKKFWDIVNNRTKEVSTKEKQLFT